MAHSRYLVFRCQTAAPSFLFEEVHLGVAELTPEFLRTLTARRQLLASLAAGGPKDCPKFIAWPSPDIMFLSRPAESDEPTAWLLERVEESSFEIVDSLPQPLLDFLKAERSDPEAHCPRVSDVSLLLWANGNLNWSGRLRNAAVCFSSCPMSSSFILKACEELTK